MRIDKEKSVCFTGYRTAKLLKTSKNSNLISQISANLEQTIAGLYRAGYTTFLSGMADGFDMLAAEAVLRLRTKHPQIRLIAVVPFMGQELGYSELDKERYKVICELAYQVVFTSEYYSKEAYFIRNDFLLDNSSVVVCYYDGQRGGTMYTVNRARLKGLPVINLCAENQT